jgi:uncharacterized protein
VLLEAIKEGAHQRDYFAYAARVAEDGRYQGLMLGELSGSVYLDDASVLVKPDLARQQIEAEAQVQAARAQTTTSTPAGPGDTRKVANGMGPVTASVNAATSAGAPVAAKLRRFHGSIKLDETRIGRDAGKVAEEIVQHLTALLGSEVEVTLEIQARLPGGAPDSVVRTVSENARTLKFDDCGFEEE